MGVNKLNDETPMSQPSSTAAARTASVSRDTLETQITVSLNLDGTGAAQFDTGIPFLEHIIVSVFQNKIIDFFSNFMILNKTNN